MQNAYWLRPAADARRPASDGASLAQGVLYLWFPDPHLLERAIDALHVNGSAERPSPSCVRVELEPGELGPCVLDVGSALGDDGARQARALLLRRPDPPALDDMGRVVPFRELYAAIQTDWLLDQFERGLFTSHFHPIVHTHDIRRVFAHEALLRGCGWRGAPLEPLAILQFAREAGLLEQLDLAACRCAIRHAARLEDPATVFVNFSPAMMKDADRCLRSTLSAVEAAGLSPDRFVFEVIEADHIDDANHLQRVLEHYRRDGFRVALDDLGAGWSTLNLVHRLRPDFIKLDRELIRDVHEDPVKDLIATKLLEIGRGLGIRTIVEGVEKPQELRWAQSRGADFVQGFLIARPAPSPGAPS
ncbi:MAG TPA: EAL domain-containing protein [Anaeromyxobacter sp.]|nr:EAL domain-containing protein [Anaeromyxobacter sp.]